MAKTCPDCQQQEPNIRFYSKRSSKCVDCQKTYMANYRANSRLEAIYAYGGPTPKCACPGCPENRLPFLSVDHINNGGNVHRAELAHPRDFLPGKTPVPNGGKVSPGGGAYFRWLKENGYPPGYRVLCYNCNIARGTGPCPVHEITSDARAISSMETGHATSD